MNIPKSLPNVFPPLDLTDRVRRKRDHEPLDKVFSESVNVTKDEPNQDKTHKHLHHHSSNLVVLRKASSPMSVVIMGHLDAAHEPYSQFLHTHSCYDLMPFTCRLILLDARLAARRAFVTLRDNNAKGAAVWQNGKIAALLTYTDFLGMLLLGHTTNQDDLDMRSLDWWINHAPKQSLNKKPNIIDMEATTSVLEAVEVMCVNHIHRMPIYDPDTRDILFMLPLETAFKLVQKQMRKLPVPAFMHLPAKTVNVGTWENIATVTPDTSISTATEYLLHRGISSMPVLDNDGAVVDVLNKGDLLMYLEHLGEPANKTETLGAHTDLMNRCVREAMLARTTTTNGKGATENKVPTVTDRESICSIIELLAMMECRCVFVLDSDKKISGAVSCSDLLKFMVLTKPCERALPK